MKTALMGSSAEKTKKDFSKLENMSIETCKAEKEKKRMKKIKNIQELWDNEKRCNVIVMPVPEKG